MMENSEGCKKKPQAFNTTLDPLVAYLRVNISQLISRRTIQWPSSFQEYEV